MPLRIQELRQLVEKLKDSDDDDCVFYPPWSLMDAPRTREEVKAAYLAKEGETRMYTFYRVRVLVSPAQNLDAFFAQSR